MDENNTVMCEISDDIESSLQSDTKLLINFNNRNGTDLSGYSYNGTLMGDVDCSVTGKNDYGCQFDGDQDYVRSDIENIEYSLTLSAWFKTNDSRSISKSIFSRRGADYSLSIDTNGLLAFQITPRTDSGDIIITLRTTSIVVNDSRWHHGVGTFNNEELKIYLDGLLIDSDTYTNSSGMKLSGIYTDIEGYNYSACISPCSSLNGTVDEVAIYSKVLTANEVTALYNLGKTKLYEQLLPNGAKEIDITNCNLQSDEKYNFVGFTNNNRLDQEFIVK